MRARETGTTPDSWTVSRRSLLGSAATAGFAGLFPTLAASAAPANTVAAVDLYLGAQMRKLRIPGMAVAVVRDGRLVLARNYGTASVEFAQKVGDAWNGAVALNNLGDLALYDGDWARAIELCQQSSDIRRGLGNRWGAALSLCNVALAQRELGLLDDAARSVREALEDSLAVDAMTVVLACFEIGALLAADRGRPREAAVLLGAHDQLREELETTDPDYERSLLEGLQAKCHALLGDEEFARAFEHGRSLILEDAAALVVAVTLDA